MINKNLFLIINRDNIILKDGISYENDDYYIVSNSELYDLNYKIISLKNIIDFYKKNVELANVISNIFTIIIIDKKNNKIFFSQDINGDSIPIYYYKNKDYIIISNKLKNIMSNECNSFIMNKHSISYFIKKGYIPNKETLIKGIYKLIPKYNLIIDYINKKDKFVKKKINYNRIKKYNNSIYIEEIKKIIEKYEKNKKATITLSNGYDSNFILNFLNKKKTIEAFSIGGVVGQDETKIVEENIKNYDNINLNVSYVDTYTLSNYPDLIYRLEGALYEKGIFLQYELLKLIGNNKDNNKILFAGEGADQVFSYEYYYKSFNIIKFMKYIKSLFNKSIYLDEIINSFIKGGLIYKNHAYKYLTYLIIKKNGILMNEINVNCVYPYLSKNIIDMAYFSRYKNILNKKSHISACSDEIDPNIMKNIVKVGGTTEPVALFKYCSYMKDIELFVEKSNYNILKINKNKNSNDYLDYLLKVLYVEIFEYLYIDNYSNIEEKRNLKLIDIIKEKLK